MTPYQQAMSLIAMAEQTYIENYYGKDVIPLFTRTETTVSTDSDSQHAESAEGQPV